MPIHFGEVPANSILPIHFPSFDGTGASASLVGLAVEDIRIFKGTSAITRSSIGGINLVDTDGMDIAGMVGANAFSIDLSDNGDVGFYEVGAFYNCWIDSVSIEGQILRFLAATWRIKEAETTVGRPNVHVVSLASAVLVSIWSYIIKGTHSAEEILRALRAWLLGKVTGAATTTPIYHDPETPANPVITGQSVDALGNRNTSISDLS